MVESISSTTAGAFEPMPGGEAAPVVDRRRDESAGGIETDLPQPLARLARRPRPRGDFPEPGLADAAQRREPEVDELGRLVGVAVPVSAVVLGVEALAQTRQSAGGHLAGGEIDGQLVGIDPRSASRLGARR